VAQVPAMNTGEDITVAAPVSAKLAGAIPNIQATLAGWYPELRRVHFTAPTYQLITNQKPRGVGCFFSGGVDSFYSAITHADEVDTLIFVHGFDVPLANVRLRERVSTQLRAAAASLGKRLVEVETNAREILDPYGNWGTHTHGSALASVAHLLSGMIGKVYVPSSACRDEVFPWGSHAALDPLWGSEALEVVYDIDDATRADKTFAIARHDAALKHLRVCWQNAEGAYNCGRCEKCMRTMVTLQVAGALERCGTFDAPLDLAAVARLGIVKPARRRFYEDILKAARAAGDERIVRAIEGALTAPRQRGWLMTQAGRVKCKALGWCARLRGTPAPTVQPTPAPATEPAAASPPTKPARSPLKPAA
jgi:hypothetical protein